VEEMSFFELLPCNYWGTFLLDFINNAFYFAWSFEIHYDPLMRSQKEAPRKHPWVLSRKVAKMV
jgi:hypothetical protein